MEEDEPTDFKWGKQGGQINRNAVIRRKSFYEKTVSFWGLALDVKNGRFSLPSLKDADVEVGSNISPWYVLCVIEAMKLYNDIESEVSGKIVKVLVDDSSPVEFDQPLFLVDPT